MDVRARIKHYFATVISEPVGDEDDIFKRGIVNSLFAMQLVLFVEREFSIVAERQDLDIRNFSSIAALVAFVEGKLSLTANPGVRGWTSA
jgi:acyl carrier protein